MPFSFSMTSPTHSFGESNWQPRTPCSMSKSCGGSRSIVGRASARAAFCRLAFFKSAGAPVVSETESIIKFIINLNVYSANPHENIFPPTPAFLFSECVSIQLAAFPAKNQTNEKYPPERLQELDYSSTVHLLRSRLVPR